jgi:hypothetical protein
MTADIGKGDWVEALLTVTEETDDCITQGAVYQVSGLTTDDWTCYECGEIRGGIQLVGHRNRIPHVGWCVCLFRPAFGGHEDTIRAESTTDETRAPTKVKA